MSERETKCGLPSAAAQWLARKLAVVRTRRRHRTADQELAALARSLAERGFPRARRRRRERLTLQVDRAGGVRFEGDDRLGDSAPPSVPALARELTEIGVETLDLDCLLEAGQVRDAVLCALRAGRRLADAEPSSEPTGWAPREIASAMVHSGGMRRFCTEVRYDRNAHRLSITYAYCELVFSRLVRRLTGRTDGGSEHRVLFAAAPWVGLGVGALASVDLLLWWLHPAAGLAYGAVLAILLGLGAAYAAFTVGSVLYDREHRDALLGRSAEEITSLSVFPITDPNPLLKFGPDGSLLYANPAARDLMDNLGCTPARAAELLGEGGGDWLGQALEGADGPPAPREAELSGRTIRYTASRFPDERAVLVSGTDITRLKQLERDLRDANERLEQNVMVKTFDLLLTQDVTIMSLVSLAETRDSETGEHIDRTRKYVRLLAERLRKHPRFRHELDDDEMILRLYRSAPLHDIGKVGIADKILLKPGKLAPQSYEEMKKHTILGGDALKWAEQRLGSDSFLRVARDIAYYHHEKWDGSGYPFGLQGEQIPTSARLMALADVYDALTSKRRYKDAYTHEVARKMIEAERGTHFDPDVVGAFLEVEEEFRRIASAERGAPPAQPELRGRYVPTRESARESLPEPREG